MTDKQIIIDKLKNDITCKENIINHLADTNIELQKQLKAKEQECERLKHDNDYEVGALEGTIENLKAERDQERNAFINEIKKNNKLKQTLTEIKEIAEVLITITDEYDNCYHKSECDKCLLGINGDCQYIKVEQILQKISEVEDD